MIFKLDMGKVLGARDIDLLGQCNAYDQQTVKHLEKKLGKITDLVERWIPTYNLLYNLQAIYALSR